jgi:hypothetical protein
MKAKDIIKAVVEKAIADGAVPVEEIPAVRKLLPKPPRRRRAGSGVGATYVDDNFGTYQIRDQEDVDFYFATQRASTLKKCVDCGRMVRIKPEYECCSPCADARERGFGY